VSINNCSVINKLSIGYEFVFLPFVEPVYRDRVFFFYSVFRRKAADSEEMFSVVTSLRAVFPNPVPGGTPYSLSP